MKNCIIVDHKKKRFLLVEFEPLSTKWVCFFGAEDLVREASLVDAAMVIDATDGDGGALCRKVWDLGYRKVITLAQ